MSISTYAELQTAVGNWLHRSDLGAVIPDFISLAESRIYFGDNPVRVSAMQEQDASTTVGNVITLPTGYLETIRLAGTTGGQYYALDYKAPSEFSYYENQSGNPVFYTVIGNEIKVAPNGGTDYIHDYYKQFDALSTTPTNWLLTNSPNVYLFGALVEALLYIQAPDNEVMKMGQRFNDAVQGLNKSESKRFQANAMRVVAA